MAQWRGQFTWLTHQTKLEDAEAVLRRAVVAFRGALPAEAAGKAKAVRHLAERVLNLRVKLLRARRAAQPPVDNSSPYAEELMAPERAVLSAGLAGILSEFGAADVME